MSDPRPEKRLFDGFGATEQEPWYVHTEYGSPRLWRGSTTMSKKHWVCCHRADRKVLGFITEAEAQTCALALNQNEWARRQAEAREISAEGGDS